MPPHYFIYVEWVVLVLSHPYVGIEWVGWPRSVILVHWFCSSGISGSDPNSRTRISLDAPLPASYQLLLEKFNSVDTVVSMYQRRKEICTFSKLEKAVEEMTRRYVHQCTSG